MSDRAAFLRSICAAADDDAPRLVYADWLQENGEPERAEFIRLQCKRARMPEQEMLCLGLIGPHTWEQETWTNCRACKKQPAGLCEYHQIEGRERQLLGGDLSSRIMGDLPGRPSFLVPGGGLLFRAPPLLDPPDYSARMYRFELWRGFVERITHIPAADWLTHADAILAEHPVREVWLTTWPEIEHSTECVPEINKRRYRIVRESRWGAKYTRQDDFIWERDVNLAGGSDDEVRGMVERAVRLQESRSAPEALVRLWWPGVTFHLPGTTT